MHDRLDHHGMNEDAALAAALRALPDATPPADAWPQLAARTRRRRTARRILWTGLPAALAACAALFLAWPHLTLHRHMPAPVRIAQSPSPARTVPANPPIAAPATSNLAALQTSSAQWQAWVQNLDRNGAPLDGRALASAVALQDRIGLIDLQLSAARNPATVADLWQQRIVLLQQLGLLHLQPYLVAEQQARPGHAIPM
ncbi:MAG: hypothetical protein OJF55_000018 [Rhodanobacteraceae bacterium]|jgi:hypothetical protein|nr:MAG: hypothetical protein OJF55_000018 [Rhodanobacteraceae bacterium]